MPHIYLLAIYVPNLAVLGQILVLVSVNLQEIYISIRKKTARILCDQSLVSRGGYMTAKFSR